MIEAPGNETRRKNTTLLVKPDRVTRLARPAAAMALSTLQCYAPAGGRGNLTSLRGGGPLTTLAIPGVDPCPLWHFVWANVPFGKAVSDTDLPRVFPWLAPTRTADRFPATTPVEAHPLQAFWGMPRRIRLDFADNPDALPCDLSGIVDPVVVTGWRQRPNGVKYVAGDHPLSPSYRDAKGGGWLPVHSQPGGIGYRDWAAIAYGEPSGPRRAAPCITCWYARSQNLARADGHEPRLFAAGYDMDNMKARSFVESEMPLPGTDPLSAETFATVARHLVAAAELVARSLRLSVRDACFGRDTKFDAAPLAAANKRFWAGTGDHFFTLLRKVAASSWEKGLARVASRWHAILRAEARRLFDQAAPLDPAAASFDPRKIVRARLNLVRTLSGYGAQGIAFFSALELPEPEPRNRGGRRRNSRGRA
ncbi:MAG TPA: type I-E CRISPR-associated protein Cse1/CasA [Stellaceae bacterium]